MSQLSAAAREALGAAVDAAGLIVDGDDLAFYGADRCRGGWPVAPGAVVLPRTVAEVCAVVRACAEHGVAIVPSGGRTGLAGGATATQGEVVLSLERMRQILEIDARARWVRCEAGVTVEAVRAAAAEVGLCYPIDFAAKGSAQVGGSIATNAGGINVIRYGMTREWVMGLDVVLASGELLRVGGALVKNNTGYDLRQLFVGSEGTLGIIVGATLRLTAPASGRVVALCAVASDDAVLGVFAKIGASGLPCSGFECFDRASVAHVLAHRHSEGAGPFPEPVPQHVLVEIELDDASEQGRERILDRLTEILALAQEEGEVLDAIVASTAAQEAALWSWREEISESLHVHTPHKADVALPVSRIAEFLHAWRAAVARELPEIEAVCFGHVGDGNLHLNLLRPPTLALDEFLARCHRFDESLYALVEQFHGSVSAEHGIGLLKRDHLHHSRSEREIELMRAIKRVFDPQGLLNPGKIF